MSRRLTLVAVIAAVVLGANAAAAAAAPPGPIPGPIPSGERDHGQSVLEPVYNAEKAGEIGFVSTPNNAPMRANPRAWSPFFVPVYPLGADVGTLLCTHMPVDNCPDHGFEIAGAAAQLMPAVYGGGVLGHDHVMDFPGGEDFNVAWEPVLVLFTSTAAALDKNNHLITEDQIDDAVAAGIAEEFPLPPATFHCEKVSARVYQLGTAVPGVPVP